MFILCFAVDNKDSVDNVRVKWIKEINDNKPSPDTPVMLVATKIDLRGKKNSKDFATTVHGRALSEQVGADKYMECSAMTQENVSKVFEEAVRLVLWPAKKKKSKADCKVM